LPRFAWLVTFVALVIVAAYAVGLPEEPSSFASALARSCVALAVSSGLVSLFALIAGTPLLPRFVVFGSDVLLIPAFPLIWALVNLGANGSGIEQVLAIASSEEGALLELDLGSAPERSARLAGVVVAGEEAGDDARLRKEIARTAELTRASVIVLGRAAQSRTAVVEEVARLHREGLRVRTLALFYEEWLGKLPIGDLERTSLLFDINELHRASYAHLKRMVDVVLALLGGVGFLMAVPLVALGNLAGNRGPLLFRQERVGKDGRVFTMVKFRTMPPSDSLSAWTDSDDPRLGAVGSFLRATHLDELPQFINVLRRELSFVGPRPEQPHYVDELEKKIPFYQIRHLVRPGITGWAQVNYGYGSTELDALEKLQYEFYYLRHQSLVLDLRILGRTLRCIVGRRGR